MFKSIAYKLFGSKNERELRRLWPLVEKINSLEPELETLDDVALAGKTPEFRTRLDQGESLDSLLPEAFAVAREASRRVLGMRHFDVQLIGGMVLHGGKIAEMKTGEGKTLCATLPVYLNALAGKGVHVVTVNDYLARRDAESMGRLYGFLGMSTGVILSGLDPDDRYEAYGADITYGQNNEFGFDFLRDNMKLDLSAMAQREHNFAIVDEVDSILIDEARTPLIISGPAEDATEKYGVADQIIRKLSPETHFTVDLKSRQSMLTEEGVQFIEELIKVENLYDPRNIQLVHHLNQALKAHSTMKRDVDYVVRNNQVIIVDEFTGRLMAGRRWSDGLHQAVEAKEGVPVARENQTLATITFQNYFRMYKKLAGMTGTADTEAVEFRKIYNLDVVIIPTNRDMIRKDFSDVVFVSEPAKFTAVCDEIEKLHDTGQPVLVGTASIAKSEALSEILAKRNIPHHVLNAKHHEREAEIVAQAGRFKAVTISTNMAGRGTDILLGGNAEFLAASEAGTRDPENEDYQERLAYYRAVCAKEREQVLQAGGLHILGTERHESRRIDNQLRGRSGRQGDPGTSRFYVSLEDDLMKRFGGERMKAIMSRVGVKDEDAIEGQLVARAIENAQKKVEAYHFDVRKHLLEYDDVLSKQREVIYSLRNRVLRNEGVAELVVEAIDDVIEETILLRADEREAPEKWDLAAVLADYNRYFGFSYTVEELLGDKRENTKAVAQQLFDLLKERAHERYGERRERLGDERLSHLERVLYLRAIDFFWKEHLSNIDHLKEGIGLRGYGQKNPLHEYQREAFELFSSVMFLIKTALLQNLFLPELPSEEELRQIEEQEREMQRQIEAQAQTIHHDVLEEGEPEEEGEPALTGNREERRRKEKAAGKGRRG